VDAGWVLVGAVIIVAVIPVVAAVVVAFAAATRRPALVADETQLRSIEREFRTMGDTMSHDF
jgi:hypothetical protein